MAPHQGCFQSNLFLRLSCLGAFCCWHPTFRCPEAFPVLRASLLAFRGDPGARLLKSNNTKKPNRKPHERDPVPENSGVVPLLYPSVPHVPPKSFVQWKESKGK